MCVVLFVSVCTKFEVLCLCVLVCSPVRSTVFVCITVFFLLVNCPVADDDRSVVGRRGEQWVKSVIGHAPHCFLMVSVDRK